MESQRMEMGKGMMGETPSILHPLGQPGLPQSSGRLRAKPCQEFLKGGRECRVCVSRSLRTRKWVRVSAWICYFSGHQITCSLLPAPGTPWTTHWQCCCPLSSLDAKTFPACKGPVLALQVTLDTLPSPPPSQRAAGPLPTTPHRKSHQTHRA